MKLQYQAACGCHPGRIRANNQDNFYFDGKCLEQENQGLANPAIAEDTVKTGLCFGVFDGMGGEAFGEVASFLAARQMQTTARSVGDFLIPERKYLLRLTQQLNGAVVAAQKELATEHMGTTMAVLYFSGRYVYVCNLGDSRVYRLRDGEFLQISKDHVSTRPVDAGKKPPLTQYLGMDPEELTLDPHIAKGELQPGDRYLLCSDGLTDMLSNFDITEILLHSTDAEAAVRELMRQALDRGGRDNITAIVCKIL